jgi:hypothetical protein
MLKRNKRAPTTADANTVAVLPHELRVGDCFIDPDGAEWELVTNPSMTWLGGWKPCAQVRRVGDPATSRQVVWQSYRPVGVRRPAA